MLLLLELHSPPPLTLRSIIMPTQVAATDTQFYFPLLPVTLGPFLTVCSFDFSIIIHPPLSGVYEKCYTQAPAGKVNNPAC